MTSGVADPARSGKCSCKHKFLVFTSLTTVFLFSGTVFGWGAFSSMLTQEGYYDFLCPAPYDKRRPCEMQMQALNSAFTWATTCVSLFAFVNGWLVDVLGPTKVTIISDRYRVVFAGAWLPGRRLRLKGLALLENMHALATESCSIALWIRKC
eukprot:Skav200937  [mRNA]  locus=scaffold2433:749197:759204:+ [translate_table: standard]